MAYVSCRTDPLRHLRSDVWHGACRTVIDCDRAQRAATVPLLKEKDMASITIPRLRPVLTACSLAIAALAVAENAVPTADRAFAEKAAMGGAAEVQTGRMAEQKAMNDQVKQFGARMAQDHAKAGAELKQIAAGKGLTLPTSPSADDQRQMDKLEKLAAADFDRTYMTHMVADHKKDIAEFEKEASSGKDPEIKAFAAKTLPTLREHLKLAQAADAAVRK
jgi:putative membrane protein